jgi:glycosyltransferase involved in cell wall biosynthesis
VKPVLLVTSDIPPDRVAPFRALHERTPIVVARFGGARRHAAAGVAEPGVPVLDVTEREVFRHAASARYRAVVAGTVGRVALPAAYAGARIRRTPFVLWSALWSAPHVASVPLLHHLYRHAGAVAAYGEHVAGYAAARGARNVVVAPQAVDPAFWSERTVERPRDRFEALYVGRIEAEKGVDVLLEAWGRARLDDARLTLVGAPQRPGNGNIVFEGPRSPGDVRNFLGRAGVLVVPSIATRAFKEPWALVVNEAMHQQLPVIATDAVGAAAGGLVRHERNGLVVPEHDADALARALERLAGDPDLRTRLGEHGARDVAAFTPQAWAAGMARAIELAGA